MKKVDVAILGVDAWASSRLSPSASPARLSTPRWPRPVDVTCRGARQTQGSQSFTCAARRTCTGTGSCRSQRLSKRCFQTSPCDARPAASSSSPRPGSTRPIAKRLFLTADAVRRGGIEPPTRGFSARQEITDLPDKMADPDMPRGGFGAVSDPEEAVRAAIKTAIDAGRLELAARLLDVLRETVKAATVVRLETVKRGC
jgi:hypothetical protein